MRELVSALCGLAERGGRFAKPGAASAFARGAALVIARASSAFARGAALAHGAVVRAAGRGVRAVAVVAVALLWGQVALAQGTVSISGPSASLMEGESYEFTVTLTDANTEPVTVPYTLGGAISNADVHGILTGRSVVIPAGRLSANFVIFILVDGSADPPEAIRIDLGTPTVPSGSGAPTAAAIPGNGRWSGTIAGSSDTMALNTRGSVTVAAGTNASGGTAGQTASFTVTVGGFSASRTLIHWAVGADGSPRSAHPRMFAYGAERGIVPAYDFRGNPLGVPVAPDCAGNSDCTGQGGISSFPKGAIFVEAGTNQSATIQIPLASEFNFHTIARNFPYQVRLLREVVYTEAGAPPALPHAYYTNSNRPAAAGGSVSVPLTPAVVKVQRPDATSDDPAGRGGLPRLGSFQLDVGRTDIPQSRGGGTYTLREEPSIAEQRRVQALLNGYDYTLTSTQDGYAALFAVDLCPATGCSSALQAVTEVRFVFRIGGTNGGLDVDYRAPIALTGLVRPIAGTNNWEGYIQPGQSGIIIIVPLVDDDVAEVDETLNLQILSANTQVTVPDTAPVSVGLSPNDRSRDFTILGAEPAAASSPAGSVSISHSRGQARQGFRRTFTFSLTDDDTAPGDTQTGADADYRIWFTLHFSGGAPSSNGDRFWSVLADGTDTVFIPTNAGARNPFLSARDSIRASAGRYLERTVGRHTGTESPIPAVGYGYVVIRQGQTEATLGVVISSDILGTPHMAVALFAVDNNDIRADDTPLPVVDFTEYSFEEDNSFINTGHGSSPAWIRFNSGAGNGGVAEGSTHTYDVNFGGVAPTGGVSAMNPVDVTWRILGVGRHGTTRIMRQAHLTDITVTRVTTGTGVAFVGGAGTQGTATIRRSWTPISILAEQTLRVTSWESHDSDMFDIAFTVRDDNRSEPDEAFIFQVTTNRPNEVGEVPGRGTFIMANDAASVRPRAIRGTNMAGDNTSPRSWNEAPPSDNNAPLRFRLEFPAGGPRPEGGAAIAWEVRSELGPGTSATSVATRDDFLLCTNEDCTSTQLALTLPSGRTPISASEAAKQTGPWYIWLPFTLNADGQAEPAEAFVITAPSGAVHSGVNLARVTGMPGSNTPDGLPLGVVTIAASTADVTRLAVGIGNADCSGSTATCEAIPAGNINMGVGAVAAATSFVRTESGAQAALRSAARSDTVVGFPITFHTPLGQVSSSNFPRLSAENGSVTIGITVGGTLLTNGAPADSGAALSEYENTWYVTFSRTQVRNSWRLNPRIYVPLPLASVTSAETLTASITSVRGNGGAVSQTADTMGQVSVRQRGGYFRLSTDGATATANTVAEGSGSHTYTVHYEGLNPIPAGGVTLDWAVVATTETPATAADFGAGTDANLPGGDNAISFAAGAMDGATQTFDITLNDDTAGELQETFRVQISDLRVNGQPDSSLSISQDSVTTTIQTSDAHVFVLLCPTLQVGESSGLDCEVTYFGGGLPSAGAMLDWSVGLPNADYTADLEDFGTGTSMSLPQGVGGVTFPGSAVPGAVQTITVPIFDDTVAEDAETFVLGISNPRIPGDPGALTLVQEGQASVDLTILASDAALTVTCAAPGGILGELMEGTATTVANCRQTTGSALTSDVQVHYTLYDSHGINTPAAVMSATQATDFDTNMGTLTIPSGTASGVDVALQITATSDNAAEAAENFSLVVSHALGASYARSDVNYYADLTVAMSMAGDVLQFGVAVADSVTDVDSDTGGTQVNEDVGTVAFTVSLTPSSGSPPAPASNVTVDWAVSGVDTGTDLTGYPATGRTVTFTPADYQTAKTVTLAVNDDSVNEALETLTITLSNSSGPPIASASTSAELGIADNDALVFTAARMTPASGAIDEGNSQVFSITPSGGSIASGTTVTVHWSVGADADAATADAAAGDFRATGQTSDTTALASFPSSGTTPLSFTSQTAQTVTIWTLDDSATEAEETFQFSLATPDGADGASSSAGPVAVQIAASDAPVFSITAVTGTDPSVNREGQTHSFSVVGSGTTPAANVVVTCTVSGSDVTAGDFRVSSSATEGLNAFPTQNLTFTSSNHTTAQTCSFYSFDDSTVEGDENFAVTLSIMSGTAEVGTPSAQGTITFSDFRVGFEASTYSVTEGETLGNDGVLTSDETGQACVAVTTPDSGTNFPTGVSFSLSTSTRAVTASADDYVAITNQVVGPFTNTIRRSCFNIQAAHDVLNEGAETFALDLAPPPGENLAGSVTINPSQATVTIPANDTLMVSVSRDQQQAAEGASARFLLAYESITLTSDDGSQTETITYEPTADVTVTWTLSGTGITPADFTDVTSLSSGNSHTSPIATPDLDFEVAIADEGMDPDDTPETFTLTVTGGSTGGRSSGPGSVMAVTGAGATANVEIVAASTFYPTFTLSATNPTVTEFSSGTIGFGLSVALSIADLDAAADVVVNWRVNHITTSDADFNNVSGMVTFEMDAAQGDPSDPVNFNLAAVADDLNEDTETFTVSISVAGGGNYNVVNEVGTLTINDQATQGDFTHVTIERASTTASVVGEAATASFTVTLSGGIRTGALSVPLTFGGLEEGEFDITAPAMGDYDNDPATPDTAPPATATGFTLVFAGPSATITPTATDARTVTVNLIGDELNEAQETLTLTGAAVGASGLRIERGGVSYENTGDNAANVGIEDDDTISVSIAVATGTDADPSTNGHQREEGTAVTFTVTLDHASAADASIPYTIGDLTVLSAADYSDTGSSPLTIPAGQTTGTIIINLLEDADTTATESLTVTLTPDDAATSGTDEGPTVGTAGGAIDLGSTASATTNIIPAGSVTARTLTVTGAATHSETDANTTITYTVTRARTVFTSPTTVTWTITPGAAEAADFAALTGTITFPTTTTFDVTIIGDDVNEHNEQFSVQLSVADNTADSGTSFGTPAVTTINDDDAISYSIAADAATVDENAASATAAWTISLTGASEGDITIRYTVASSTTAQPADYAALPSPSTVLIAAGDLSAPVELAITADEIAEADETIRLNVSQSPTLGTGAGTVTRSPAAFVAGVTIPANDALTITIARMSGESGSIAEDMTESASFTVSVTGTSAAVVQVPFTIGGTGITNSDYDIIAGGGSGITQASTGGTLEISAGTDQSGTITVRTQDDSTFEGPETLTVTFVVANVASSGAGPVTLTAGGSNTASVEIADDEGVTVSIAAATSAMATEGSPFSIRATVSPAHTQPITLTVTLGNTPATTDNDAETADDIGAISGATIAANAGASDISIATQADTLNEGDETFTVTITGTTTAMAGGMSLPVSISGMGTQTLTVQDGAEDAITVDIALATGQMASEDEAGEVTFAVSLSGGTRTRDLLVPFEVSGPGGTLVLEDSEFDITMPGGIAADASGGTLRFPLATADSTTELNIVLDLVGDSLNEAAEDVLISLAAPGGTGLRHGGGRGGSIAYSGVMATEGLDSPTVSVTDDDAITYSIAAPAAVAEGNSGTVTLTFTVTLSGESAGPITINYGLGSTETNEATGGPASLDGRDYTYPADYNPGLVPPRGGVVIAAGETMEMLDIAVLGDTTGEGDEIVTVTLFETPMPGDRAGTVTRATEMDDYRVSATITGDDAANTLGLNCPSGPVTEGGPGLVCSAVYATNANQALAAAANLTWTVTHEGGAVSTSAADFTGGAEALTGTLTIPVAGSASGASVNFTLPGAVDDTVSEADETFTVTLSVTAGSTLPTGTNIAGGTAMPVISASDPIMVSIGNVSASEGAENADSSLPVTFAPAGVTFDGDLELSFRPIPGAGVTDGDYGIATSPVSIPSSEVQGGSYNLPITVRADDLNEGEETVTVRLTDAVNTSASISLAGADEAATERNGVLTIAANDPTTAAIAADAATAAEGTAAEFTVTLSGGTTTADVMVAYSFAIAAQANTGEANDSGNPDASDPGSGSITIPSGASSGTITINISPDGLAEGAEMLAVTLGALTGGGGGGISGTGSASVSIPENAAALHVVSVAGPDAAVQEGGTATFTFSLPAVTSNPRAAELTANYMISGVDPGDYTGAATGQVTFPVGSTSQTVDIAIADDNLNEGAETLTVALTSIVNAASFAQIGGAAASGQATVTIEASDPLSVTLARTDSGAIVEGNAANFQFVLSGAQLTADVMIPYTISGTGITAADLSGNTAAGLAADLTGTVSVAAADSTSTTTNSAPIIFTAVDDGLNEATETFAIAIGTPAVAAGGGAITATQPAAADGQVDITDNDALTLSLGGPASVLEGTEAEFTVTLAGAAMGSAGALAVTYTVAVGNSQNAAASVDPNSDTAPDIVLLDANGADAANTGTSGMASGSLTIAAGATTAVIRLRAQFDNLNEGDTDETVTVTLTNVMAAAGAAGAAAGDVSVGSPGNAQVDIENVNAARTLSVVAPPMVMEGGTIEFAVGLTGAAPSVPLTVTWTLEPDGAQLEAASGSGLGRNHGGPHRPGDPDITPPGGSLTGTVTFPAGSMASQMVSVPVRQDPLNEGDEALRLSLSTLPAMNDLGGRPDGFPPTAPATQVGVPSGRTVIPANDPIRLALVRPMGQAGAQSAGGNFGFAVSFGCADGTSVAAGNCEPVVPTTPISIPYTYRVGSQSFDGTLAVAAGDTADALNAAAPGGTPVTPPTAAMAAIMASTTAQTVSVSFGTPVVTPPDRAPQNAALPEARAITSMEQMELEEQAETARREGREDVPQTVATAQVQVGAFSASPNAQRIDAPEGTTAEITVTLGVASGTLSGALMIPWSLTLAAPGFAPAGSAAATAADFMGGTVPGGTLAFPADATDGATQTIQIAIATDDLDEMGGEYFQVALGTPAGADAANVAVDRTPVVVLIPSLRATLSVADLPAVPEGTNAVFTLNLQDFVGGMATTQPVTVNYILEDITSGVEGITAQRGADFTAPERGSVVIPLGETSAQISIPVLQDGVLEPVEVFRLRITLTADGAPPADGGRFPGGGGLIEFTAAEGTATARITDDVDQANRRTQRVAAMVSVLDRQTAELATDAITDRFARSAMSAEAQSASLSLAGRSLIGGSAAPGAGATGANGAAGNDLGLALFGAGGLGSGAGLGVAGAGGAGPGDGAFGGLGAGLAGGANMWRGQDLPSLAELLRGSSFSFSAAGWSDFSNIADGLEIWGRGGASDLKGDLSGSGGTLRYKGDSIAVFVGADRPVRGDMLAGLALGYSVGDLNFTDTAGSLQGNFELSGKLSSNMLSLHPYFNWRITPEVNTWVTLGYGTGSVDLEEVDAGRTRTLPGTTDATMWMLAAGVTGRVQVAPATQLRLSFELSRVGSEVDAASFDDGARLNKARARSLRVGGEAELGRSFEFGGFALRPFATGRLRFESGGRTAVHGVGNSDAAFDLGGGVSASQPAWGLDAQFTFSDQMNSSGQEEQRLSLDLSYDLGGDEQGLTMSVQTELSERRSGITSAAQRSGIVLPEFGSAPNSLGLGGGSFGALSGGSGSVQQSIAGEIGYGVSFRQLGRAGLLTPYGRFDLRQSSSRWAAGLRLAETGGGLSLGLESGLDLRSGLGAGAREFDLLLTGQMRF